MDTENPFVLMVERFTSIGHHFLQTFKKMLASPSVVCEVRELSFRMLSGI